MGWLYSPQWSTRQRMIEHLSSPDRYAEGYVHIKSSVVGNNHWYLLHITATNQTIIGLDTFKYGGHDGYGYKDMTASMGPVEVNCPLSFLDKASDPDPNGYESAWRERVRNYHDAKRQKAKRKYESGMVLNYGGINYKLDVKAGPRRGWMVSRLPDGQMFRMSATQLGQAKIINVDQ